MHGHLAARLDPLGSEPPGDPALDPATVDLTPELMRAIPTSRAARRGAGRDLRRRPAPPSGDLLRHDRLRDRAHRRPPPARVAAPGRSSRACTASRCRRRIAAACWSACRRSRRSRATCTRPSSARSSSRSRASTWSCRCSTRRLQRAVRRRRTRGRAGHGSPRPPQRAGARRRAPLRGDPGASSRARRKPRRPTSRMPEGGTGDVKYHHGATGTYRVENGKAITVTLSPNPSHLEIRRPGGARAAARADQTSRKGREPIHDPTVVLPVLIHGDAAFPGAGRRGGDAEPAGARRLHHGRHGPHHHRTTSSASRPTPTRRARPATPPTWRRASTFRSST